MLHLKDGVTVAGRKTMTLHSPGAVSGECAPAKTLTGARDGFSLNAAVVCETHQRDKLERLCRYVSRGPIALERLSIDGDGLVVHELKHRDTEPDGRAGAGPMQRVRL